VTVEGATGARYHLFLHERRAVERNRDGATRTMLKVAGRPLPVATDLRIAARADRRAFTWLTGGLAVVAFVMAAVTSANGGPLYRGNGLGTGWQVVEGLVAVVLFWGVLALGLSTLVLWIVREVQFRRELRESIEAP
jgi:hypothetical protein